MLTVRQCMIGETAWFRKLEGEYHYMGESHGAGDVVRLVFEEDGAPVALMTWANTTTWASPMGRGTWCASCSRRTARRSR